MRLLKIFIAIALTYALAFGADSGAINEGAQTFAGKKVWLDDTPTTTTLSGAATLNKNSTRVQVFDANGSTRVVTLPTVTGNAGMNFFIINSSTTAVNLTVNQPTATTVGTVHQSESGTFYCDGVNWTGFVYTTAASGFLTADGATTGGTGSTQVFTNGITIDTVIGNTAAALTVTAKVGASNTVGNALTMAGGAGGATNATGGAASLTGGAGAGTGNGGLATLAGGVASGGATGTGGGVAVTSGASTATNGAGGAITVTSGLGTGSGAGGAFTQVSGAGGATGAGGAVASTAGRGGSTSGAAGTVTFTAGAGGASSTVTGGIASLVGGASGSGATGDGGDVKLTGGAGVGTASNGGSILLTPGVANGAAIAGGNFTRSATGMNFIQQTAAAAGADQNETMTAAQMINGIFVHTISTGRTLTTPTGAQISAGCPASVATGDSFELTVITIGTGSDDICTLTAGDGNVTFVGPVTVGPNIQATEGLNSYGTWRFRKTGASTWVGYRKG